MKWYHHIFRSKEDETKAAFKAIQEKFDRFLAILEKNNQVLKIIGDMEEKAQGEYLFDLNYILTSLSQVRGGVAEIIEDMILLGGEKYLPLQDRLAALDEQIGQLLPGSKTIVPDDFTISFHQIDRGKIFSVGGKNAQLGEMRKLGLPVPDGFAITAWAYHHFVEANDLQDRISRRLRSLNLKSFEELVRVSEEIQSLVMSSPVPADLAAAIQKEARELEKRTQAARFALRSSAVGEDTHFSFAGQYATFLNLRPDEIIDRYREVLASKFSPKAIYYFLSHDLRESDLPMSVGCMVMVDARASGVIYTRDPVCPADETLIINSTLGLGRYVVDGTLTPDFFRVCRSDGSVLTKETAVKTRRLVVSSEGGTVEERVDDPQQTRPSIQDEEIKVLTELALKLDDHYGCPQDIEWAIDQDGKLFLLQTRPLKVVALKPAASSPSVDLGTLQVLLSGGATVCPGAGGGPVYHVLSTQDLSSVPEGAVLVAPSPFPGLITVMNRVKALIIEVGGAASHMATIAREYRIPMLAGLKGVKKLPAQVPVTVDATGRVIYRGLIEPLIKARCEEYELFEDTDIMSLLKRILTQVSPLNLLNPSHPDFTIEACKTLHDLTRFAHQKAMEEMFDRAKKMEYKDRIGLRLKSNIPLGVDIIYIDQRPPADESRRSIEEAEITSAPMKAFWGGITEQGWPKTPATDLKGFITVMANTMTQGAAPEFSENSYAILSKEYMLLSLRMGYHFSTIEALCTEIESKNYIRVQYKEGGAPLDRRIRRIRLLAAILSRMGFENSSQGDFLDAMITYQSCPALLSKLRLLGRISMMTKQLDMALSNDAIAQWYVEDYVKKLNLGEGREESGCP